jgi:hypothetical protein
VADADLSLHRLIEEGAHAARRPPIEHLRRRVGRRRARRRTAGVALAAAILAAPAGWYADAGGRPGPAATGTAGPTATVATGTRTAPPSLNAAQQQALVAQHAGTLTVAPVSVRAGGSVLISGRGCAPGQAVDLGFGASVGAGVVVTVHAGASGSFEGTVAIPLATGTGVRRLWAQCSVSAQYGAVYVVAS